MMMINYLIGTTVLLIMALPGLKANALDDYVWKSDEHFSWTDMGPDYVLTGSLGNRHWTGYTLNMTSQQWLTEVDFSVGSQAGSVWWHYLVVIVPDDVRYTTNATLWITGGNQGSSAPKATDEDILVSAAMAMNTGTITAALFQVPNEHITFSSDPIQKSRTEDAIVAFTWQHFLDDTSNPEWLIYFPMVKAGLRAMDATTQFAAQQLKVQPMTQKSQPEGVGKGKGEVKYATIKNDAGAGGIALESFVVTGASKRGWTTWLVGAVDPARVVAIVPIVLDAINFVEVEHHQFRSYGGWSFALQDYTDLNLTERFDDPNMIYLQQFIDPYFYKERLNMPKLVINAGMDEFQQPDDTHFWWSGMPEPKHFMMLPNTEHSCITGILEAVPAASAWIQALLHKDAVPEVNWTINEEDGAITVTLGEEGRVHSAHVWWAYSCGENAFDGGKLRRDFRIASVDNPCNCGIYIEPEALCTNLKSWWNKEELEVNMVGGKRTYTAHIDAPEDGRWVAYFVDIKFLNRHGLEQLQQGDMAQMAAVLDKQTEINYQTLAKSGEIRKQKHADGNGQVLGWELLSQFDQFAGFPKDAGQFLEFTSEVSVFPNTWAYPEDCFAESCGVTLV